MKQIENFGATWSFTPKHQATPTHARDLARIVANARNVRVMGARHSWSRGIITEDTLVSLDAMNRILHVDRDKLEVTVQAGIRLHDLIKQLEVRGLALSNLGSIAEQSLAGAISTGTHGTGLNFRCLADQAQRLALIDGRGEERTLTRDDTDFDAVAVGLGGFGIIHEVTLSVVPTFQIHAITESMPFDQLLDNLDSIVRGHDHFKFWWIVPNDEVVVFRQQRTDAPRNDSDLKRWFKDEILAVLVYRSLLAAQRLYRDPLVVATNRFLGREYAKRFERICKSHVAFLTPAAPRHRESEWAFDYADAPRLLHAYREFLLGSGHTYSCIQEIRFTRDDTFWASPSYGRNSIWLSMYNIDSPARWDDQLRKFDAFARENKGRPHWGKEAFFDPAYLSAQYPKLEAFKELMRDYDPEGKFVNRWVRSIFGAP